MARMRSGPGPQIKMIRIGQQDADVQVACQFARREAFHRGLRPDRHEHRRFDDAVRSVQQAGARAGDRALGLDFEGERESQSDNGFTFWGRPLAAGINRLGRL